jgi:hypothetical protein
MLNIVAGGAAGRMGMGPESEWTAMWHQFFYLLVIIPKDLAKQ